MIMGFYHERKPSRNESGASACQDPSSGSERLTGAVACGLYSNRITPSESSKKRPTSRFRNHT